MDKSSNATKVLMDKSSNATKILMDKSSNGTKILMDKSSNVTKSLCNKRPISKGKHFFGIVWYFVHLVLLSYQAFCRIFSYLFVRFSSIDILSFGR